MKYLCICDGGNVRSRALAYYLHDCLGHEAIAIGRRWASRQTMYTFCAWADVIVVTQPHMVESVPEVYRDVVQCVDLGEDRYGVNIHPDLAALAKAGAERLTGRKV